MRVLHTMLRVVNLEETLRFYTEALGMHLLRQKDYPDGRFTLAFVGYAPETEAAALELTWNWDQTDYTLGDQYGHVAIEVDNAAQTCERIRKLGYQVTREAGPMKHGKTILAFVEDPNGYSIEFIQKGTQFD
ncbi:lactoylglutathione lyase [Halomonas caseinilytica]|uniref:lactoylglutathione lyase n=1 Tax=Halomonas caseinilytica TaxID=438744 RepID=UPI000848BA6F|nr:lactoylglutathione lyase [Halomonas caseinilytica]